MGRKHCGKRRNCSLRAISPFSTVLSKGLFPRLSKGVIVWEWVKETLLTALFLSAKGLTIIDIDITYFQWEDKVEVWVQCLGELHNSTWLQWVLPSEWGIICQKSKWGRSSWDSTDCSPTLNHYIYITPLSGFITWKGTIVVCIIIISTNFINDSSPENRPYGNCKKY